MTTICDSSYRLIRRCLALLLLYTSACGSELKGEVEGQKFVRCAQVKPPAERRVRAGDVTLGVHDRALQVDATSPLRLAAFTGPIGRAFREPDLALLKGEQLLIWLGGLGDTEALARENLAAITKLHVATVFIAGGADRWPVIEAAFDAQPEDSVVLQGSGLRELHIGVAHFALAPGAALGRYAVDEQGCGLTREDLETTIKAQYLISWHAPQLPWGDPQRGSPELAAFARAVGASAGLFAFPEPADAAALAVVSRLGAPGTQRADGARLRSSPSRWLLGPEGLTYRAGSRP